MQILSIGTFFGHRNLKHHKSFLKFSRSKCWLDLAILNFAASTMELYQARYDASITVCKTYYISRDIPPLIYRGYFAACISQSAAKDATGWRPE